MELGVKVFAASLNIHESFEYFLKTVSGENTEEERKKLLDFLNEMRDEVVCFPKTITTSPIEGSNGWIFTKLECYISGNQSL